MIALGTCSKNRTRSYLDRVSGPQESGRDLLPSAAIADRIVRPATVQPPKPRGLKFPQATGNRTQRSKVQAGGSPMNRYTKFVNSRRLHARAYGPCMLQGLSTNPSHRLRRLPA